MKIVQFKDGKYGVRRFHLIMGWQFLDVMEDSTEFGKYWWGSIKEFVPQYCHGTVEQCKKAIQVYKSPKKKEYFDRGKAVKTGV